MAETNKVTAGAQRVTSALITYNIMARTKLIVRAKLIGARASFIVASSNLIVARAQLIVARARASIVAWALLIVVRARASFMLSSAPCILACQT